MLQQIEPGFFASFWATLFPDLEAPDFSDANLDILDPSTSLSFYLSSGNGHHKEQYELRAVPVGGGDTVNSTVLYVPEVKTVITGDVVYGNCYQYLAENPTAELRSQWLKSI